jgi:hypothetical protein
VAPGIEDAHENGPAIAAALDLRRIGVPEPVRLGHGRALHPCWRGPQGGAVSQPALPPFESHDPMHRLPIDHNTLLEPQPSPHPPIAEGLLPIQNAPDPLGQALVTRLLLRSGWGRPSLPFVEAGSRDAHRPAQHATRSTLRPHPLNLRPRWRISPSVFLTAHSPR